MRKRLLALLVVFVLAAISHARADAVFLLEEPYGHMGSWNPTGHAAVYLTDVCADTPTHLRACRDGEAGVVISRYRAIEGYDWVAIPILPYLYAVDTIQEIPDSVDATQVAAMRDAYRRQHLLAIAPSDSDDHAPKGEWYELIGSAYDRTIYGFRISSRADQDEAFIAGYNARSNRHHYSLLADNCADFARNVMNFYAPGAVHRNILADVGITTPKQVARSLVKYAKRHSEMSFTAFVIPQVPGEIHRSKRVDGVLEAVLKTKRYLLPLAILHPVVTVGLAATYLTEGRFDPRRNAVRLDIATALQSPPTVADTPSPVAGFAAVSADSEPRR